MFRLPLMAVAIGGDRALRASTGAGNSVAHGPHGEEFKEIVPEEKKRGAA